MKDPYLYPESSVLKNLGNIRDERELKMMEADYTSFRLSEVVRDIFISNFDFGALCKMHFHIFQDVYEWAGTPRTINIEKGEAVLGELSIEYADCFDIKNEVSNILGKMNKINWEYLTFDEVVKEFSNSIAALWKVHPFREGNTRTIITFCSIFIESKNIYIDSKLFKDNSLYLRNALVAANAIFQDLGDLRKFEYLYRIIEDALKSGKKMKDQVEREIKESGLAITDKRVRQIILWNRKDQMEHTGSEIKAYLAENEEIKIIRKKYNR